MNKPVLPPDVAEIDTVVSVVGSTNHVEGLKHESAKAAWATLTIRQRIEVNSWEQNGQLPSAQEWQAMKERHRKEIIDFEEQYSS